MRSLLRALLDALMYNDGLAAHTRIRSSTVQKPRLTTTFNTNGLENFWSLLKLAIAGTYVSVEPFHLVRYLDEQAYRYNNRPAENSDRFRNALQGIAEQRLTYKQLTSGEQSTS